MLLKSFRSAIFSVVRMRTNNINNRQGDQTILAPNERNREIKGTKIDFLCSIMFNLLHLSVNLHT